MLRQFHFSATGVVILAPTDVFSIIYRHVQLIFLDGDVVNPVLSAGEFAVIAFNFIVIDGIAYLYLYGLARTGYLLGDENRLVGGVDVSSRRVGSFVGLGDDFLRLFQLFFFFFFCCCCFQSYHFGLPFETSFNIPLLVFGAKRDFH